MSGDETGEEKSEWINKSSGEFGTVLSAGPFLYSATPTCVSEEEEEEEKEVEARRRRRRKRRRRSGKFRKNLGVENSRLSSLEMNSMHVETSRPDTTASMEMVFSLHSFLPFDEFIDKFVIGQILALSSFR